MKKLFTSTLFIAFLCFSAFAQQPTVWPITGTGTSPSPSWAINGYDASSSVVDGIWKLYQPNNAPGPVTTKTVYIQYNPGRVSDVTTTHSNIETNNPAHRYLVIGLKNHTDKTQLRFYYRYNNAGTESWKSYDFTITASDTEFKQYHIDVQALPNWKDYTKMPLIRFDYIGGLPTYDSATETPDLLLEIDYIGFSPSTTLPVSLINFTATKQNNGIQLNWVTASEKDNSHFDILRSGDGTVFEKISSVAGHGNSSEIRNYSFTDPNPLPGTNYYQLNQIDIDGKSSKSEIRAVNSGIRNADFAVFADNGNIKVAAFLASTGKASLVLTDVSGRKAFEESYSLSKGQNLLNISTANLKTGIYVATLSSAGEAVSVKFVVQ